MGEGEDGGGQNSLTPHLIPPPQGGRRLSVLFSKQLICGHVERTRLRADLPTPAEAGFAKAGALQRAGTDTLFSLQLTC
jgi:hypothetical protein